MLNVRKIDKRSLERSLYEDEDVKVRVDAGEMILNGEQIKKLREMLKVHRCTCLCEIRHGI